METHHPAVAHGRSRPVPGLPFAPKVSVTRFEAFATRTGRAGWPRPVPGEQTGPPCAAEHRSAGHTVRPANVSRL